MRCLDKSLLCRRPAAVWSGLLLLALAVAARPGETTWLWSNPMPHGNSVYDLAVSDELLVQVCDRGRVYTSPFDGLWTAHDLGTTKSLRAVCFFNDRIVVTGQEGLVATARAAALDDWTVRDLATPDWLEGVAASPTRLVAVGDSGAIYVSDDAVNWTRRPAPTTSWLRGVTYGNNRFVAVGEDGVILLSADGLTWGATDSGVTEHLNRVTWADYRFVAVGNAGTALASLNGRDWAPLPDSGATGDLFTVSGGGSHLLVGGENELRTFNSFAWHDEIHDGSDFPAPAWTYFAAGWDGAAFTVAGRTGMVVDGFQTNLVSNFVWLEQGASPRLLLWDVALQDSLHVAVGDFGTLLSSPDGVQWSVEFSPAGVTNEVLLGVGGRPNLWVAVGTQGAVVTSDNGVEWTAVEPRPTANDLQGVAAWNGAIYASSGAGEIFRSPDGRQWSLAATPASGILSGLAGHPGGLVAVGENGTVLASADGVNWQPRPLGLTNWIYKVRWLEDRLLAVGQGGVILSSPDGLDWHAAASGSSAWLTDVGRLGDRFLAVGVGGEVRESLDGETWTAGPSATRESLFGLTSGREQAVAVGVEGLVLRAQSGPLRIAAFQQEQGTNRVLFSGPPGRELELEASADLRTWTPSGSGKFLSNDGLLLLEEATGAEAHRFSRGRLR